jgi:sporulation protein YlmC with PRC-barrel domain
MLRSIENVYGCAVLASDGEVGTVEEVYLDDEAWGVRYLVVNTGSWLDKRRVLISPYSVKSCDSDSDVIRVNLTQRQVIDSPDIDTHKPVSRQHESELSRYYAYPSYWMGEYLWEDNGHPTFESMSATEITAKKARTLNERNKKGRPTDVHLRSTREVKGYHLKARFSAAQA